MRRQIVFRSFSCCSFSYIRDLVLAAVDRMIVARHHSIRPLFFEVEFTIFMLLGKLVRTVDVFAHTHKRDTTELAENKLNMFLIPKKKLGTTLINSKYNINI